MKSILVRLRQGFRTGRFPKEPPKLPERFRGPLKKDVAACRSCNHCVELCPTGALTSFGKQQDLSKCMFCGRCAAACPEKALSFTKEYRMGALSRASLVADTEKGFLPENVRHELAKKLCGRSLKLRQVSAGGCSACELDFNVLHTLAWDMGRFGISAVASPRHADAVLVTGPISENMAYALRKTISDMPQPCFLIACGACACSGGLYQKHEECLGGAEHWSELLTKQVESEMKEKGSFDYLGEPKEGILPVDLFIPGCPPHPTTVLDALLYLIGRVEHK